jgi:hypothetical protein
MAVCTSRALIDEEVSDLPLCRKQTYLLTQRWTFHNPGCEGRRCNLLCNLCRRHHNCQIEWVKSAPLVGGLMSCVIAKVMEVLSLTDIPPAAPMRHRQNSISSHR